MNYSVYDDHLKRKGGYLRILKDYISACIIQKLCYCKSTSTAKGVTVQPKHAQWKWWITASSKHQGDFVRDWSLPTCLPVTKTSPCFKRVRKILDRATHYSLLITKWKEVLDKRGFAVWTTDTNRRRTCSWQEEGKIQWKTVKMCGFGRVAETTGRKMDVLRINAIAACRRLRFSQRCRLSRAGTSTRHCCFSFRSSLRFKSIFFFLLNWKSLEAFFF